MKTRTYRLDHDLGFAPNPFFRWCTLACCKPQIRGSAAIDDVIVGMAGSSDRGLGRIHPQLIYWMQVEETLTFNEYWKDPRFKCKTPRIPGPKMQMVGDRTYRYDSDTDTWAYETSMHFVPGTQRGNGDHVVRDTVVDRVLLGQRFTYWGGDGPKLPDHLMALFSNPRGQKCNHADPNLVSALHDFINLKNPSGLVGLPADWENERYFANA